MPTIFLGEIAIYSKSLIISHPSIKPIKIKLTTAK
jgi:hypothetical protein